MKRKNLLIGILICLPVFLSTIFCACKQPATVTEDKTAPAIVTEVNATLEEDKITITWKDPADTDFVGVKIYTGYVDDDAEIFGTGIIVLKDTEKFEFSNLEDGTTYLFKLASIDKSLNESEFVTTQKITYNAKKTYTCVVCKTEYQTAEEAANCCPAILSKVVKAGTLTIVHKLQNAEDKNNYTVNSTEENVTLEKDKMIFELINTYEGFTIDSYSCDETTLILNYNRNKITYTFNSGSNGKFADGSTSLEITGLYGSTIPSIQKPTAEKSKFRKWVDVNGNELSATFGKDDLTFTADYLVAPDGFVILSSGTVTTAIAIPGSSFYGASDSNPVSVKEFFLAEYELTTLKWNEVYQWATSSERAEKYIFNNAGTNGGGADHESSLQEPVTGVDFCDAIVWCNAASEKEGLTPVYYNDDIGIKTTITTASKAIAPKADDNANGYRLPTELEWEYAARGGDPNAECWSYNYSGSNDISSIGWYTENSEARTHVVGEKPANAAGLYDMTGNVWEWTWWPLDYSLIGDYRFARGGYWGDPADNSYIISRGMLTYNAQGPVLGFRLARSIIGE